MWLWRPRNLMISCWQAGELGKPMTELSLNPKAWEPRASKTEGERRQMSQLNRRVNSPFLHLYVLIQVLNRLDDAHLHWGGQISEFNLPIQTLISSRNIPTYTPRNNIISVIWASLCLDKLTHKINHHENVSWVKVCSTCLIILKQMVPKACSSYDGMQLCFKSCIFG